MHVVLHIAEQDSDVDGSIIRLSKDLVVRLCNCERPTVSTKSVKGTSNQAGKAACEGQNALFDFSCRAFRFSQRIDNVDKHPHSCTVSDAETVTEIS